MDSAPRAANRSCNCPPFSRAPIGSGRTSNMGPVSRPASICMIVMPVVVSPARMARWIGAAPRQRGSSDAWMFQQPSRGTARIAGGRISP